MRTSQLLRFATPALALFAASCLQAAGTGDGGSANTSSNGASNGGSSSGGTSGGGATGGTSSGGTSGGTTGTAVLTLGSTCTDGIGAGGLTDPCTAVGLVCTITGITTTGTCELPGTGAACNTMYGCATGNNCIAGAKGSTCVQTCTATTDCSVLTDSCDTASGNCTENVCGPGTTNGTTYYAPCNSSGTDDGVCLPVTTAGATHGACLAAGTAATYATCSGTRSASTAASSLCSAGDYCVALPTELGGGSACYPLCSTGPAGGGGNPGADGGTGAEDGGAPDSGVESDGGTTGYTCSTEASCLNPNMFAGMGGAGGKGGGAGLGVCINTCGGDGGTCPGALMCVNVPVDNLGSLCIP